MARNSQAKKRIESMYEREEPTVEGGNDRAGHMTIAFCYDTSPDLH
ncbi:hypothetical protein [Natrarchaeobaculum aegyptiacum]|nr:hypothetical protein [Natrarchaeobaculum aegyptiacum]